MQNTISATYGIIKILRELFPSLLLKIWKKILGHNEIKVAKTSVVNYQKSKIGADGYIPRMVLKILRR